MRVASCFVPGLEADQRILDASLVVLGHVLMHVWVVLPDVALGAAVWNGPEAEGWGIGVGTLKLHSEAQEIKMDWPQIDCKDYMLITAVGTWRY